MLEGRPSLTAIWVAFARAVSAYEHELAQFCPDLIAPSLLPKAIARRIQREDGRPRSQTRLRLLRHASLGLIDHLALRTYVIDEALHESLAQGIDQIVLLGAGLDARAYRINAAADAVVFEVDHPSTQAYKRKRAQKLSPTAREVRYAACDFETVSLEQALSSVSFDATRPSVWIWEGVTLYLHREAVLSTLDTIARVSAPESVLITSYATPKLASMGPTIGRIGTGLLSVISEPLLCTFEPDAIARALSERGFVVETDRLPMEVGARLGTARFTHALLVPDERIVVAKRIDA